jgi:hypothetical protein
MKLKLSFILDVIYGFRRRSDTQKLKDRDFGFRGNLGFLLADGNSLKSQQERNQYEE